MSPSELLFKLKNLPANSPITAEHIISILGALQAPQVISNQEGAYSTWDKEKQINTETLAEWIGESPNRLKQWRYDGYGPKFLKKEKHVAYKVGDVRDWIASRTVQSTTQADKLSFVSAFDNCFVEPIIYHDEQPYSLFESIELLSNDSETNITGFELFITNEKIITSYMNSNFNELENVIDINQKQTYFINGIEQKGTLAHVVAKFPSDNLGEWLPSLLNKGLNFSVVDSNGIQALEFADDNLKTYLSKRELMLKLSSKLPMKNTKGKTEKQQF